MEETNANQGKTSLCRKALGVGIMIAVAIYCIPELQDKLVSALDSLKSEWRKVK